MLPAANAYVTGVYQGNVTCAGKWRGGPAAGQPPRRGASVVVAWHLLPQPPAAALFPLLPAQLPPAMLLPLLLVLLRLRQQLLLRVARSRLLLCRCCSADGQAPALTRPLPFFAGTTYTAVPGANDQVRCRAREGCGASSRVRPLVQREAGCSRLRLSGKRFFFAFSLPRGPGAHTAGTHQGHQ